MIAAELPANEAERLTALRSYEVLDSACEAAFDDIANLTAELTGSPICLVSLIDAERQWFKARVGLEGSETPRDQAFCAHAILKPDETMVVNDALADPRFADNPLVVGEPNIRFYAGVPLVNPDGAALGTLCIIDRKPRELTQIQRSILARLAGTVSTTLELRRAVNQVRELALIDMLTQIPNRAALVAAIDRAVASQKRRGERFSLLFLDLDGFKQVNDEHGHAEGDKVLRAVGAALLEATRTEDFIGRLGGDEFAVVLTRGDNEAEAAAARIRQAIASRMITHGWPVTASIGAATFEYTPISADAALARADSLMYVAKAAGKNQVRFARF